MPIYAFQCDQCGHEFDRLQRLSDPDPDTCPACSAQAIRRKLSAPQFRLAGGGWYETDFKKDGDKKRNLVDSGGGGDKADGAKSDVAKPDVAKSGSTKSDAGGSAGGASKASASPAATSTASSG